MGFPFTFRSMVIDLASNAHDHFLPTRGFHSTKESEQRIENYLGERWWLVAIYSHDVIPASPPLTVQERHHSLAVHIVKLRLPDVKPAVLRGDWGIRPHPQHIAIHIPLCQNITYILLQGCKTPDPPWWLTRLRPHPQHITVYITICQNIPYDSLEEYKERYDEVARQRHPLIVHVVKHLFFMWYYFCEAITTDVFLNFIFTICHILLLTLYIGKYWQGLYFCVFMPSRIYTKIKYSQKKVFYRSTASHDCLFVYVTVSDISVI